MPIEHEHFLDGVSRKDDKAWEELYRYFYAPLCSYSGKIIGDPDAAEDIVQGCFVNLWRSSFRFTDIVEIPIYPVIVSFLVCSATGIFFGWYPAKKASGLNPIDAIRYE